MQKNYLDRMMRARDPRFHLLAEKLGYRNRMMQSVPAIQPKPIDEIEALRSEYERTTGRKADKRWSLATLRDKCEG